MTKQKKEEIVECVGSVVFFICLMAVIGFCWVITP